MTTKAIDSNTALQIVRNLDATPERVFEALVEPALLSKWFAPSDEFTVHVDRFDNRVGGAFRIEMRHAGGEVHIAIGTIREIDRPNRLEYTWKWEGGEMPDTLVSWELNESDSGTELVLTHDQFPNEEATEHHTKGWTAMMPRLASVLADG
jgi:glutathione S-transferase